MRYTEEIEREKYSWEEVESAYWKQVTGMGIELKATKLYHSFAPGACKVGCCVSQASTSRTNLRAVRTNARR